MYLAKDEAMIHRHAEISGFPATKITKIRKMIDPSTEHAQEVVEKGDGRSVLFNKPRERFEKV